MDNKTGNTGSGNNPQVQETRTQARGCIQLGDLLIFGFGSFIMFAKTANLLGKFAPDDWFGLAPSDYGFAAALLIEGFLVWRKVKMWLLPPRNLMEWAMDGITTMTPFILSLAAQVIDGYITTGLINSMSEQKKTEITTIVSLLIGIPILLDIGKTMVENAPAGIFDSLKQKDGSAVGSLFGWIGRLFPNTGKKDSTVLSLDVGQPKFVPAPPAKVKANGKTPEEEQEINP